MSSNHSRDFKGNGLSIKYHGTSGGSGFPSARTFALITAVLQISIKLKSPQSVKINRDVAGVCGIKHLS